MVGADAAGSAATALENAKSYTDGLIETMLDIFSSEAKAEMKQAVEQAGISVSGTDSFLSYANKIL